MIDKLEKLLRLHRHKVFDANQFIASMHHRTLLRLKRTATYKQMCGQVQSQSDQRESGRYLNMYA